MQEQLAASHETAGKAKRQLMIRAATVSALVVALLAALVLLDKKPEPVEEPEVVARTVTPPAPRVEASAPSLADSAKELVAQSTDAPDANHASLAAVPTEAASAPQGVPEETMDPTAPVLGVPNKVPATAVERPTTAKGNAVPMTPRLTLGQEPMKPVVTPPPAPTNANKAAAPAKEIKEGFVVQLGVFTDYANAEQLQKKLTAAGVAARLETRVQVGPFKSRQEALAAQAQLKKLGLESGMLVAGHTR